ANGGASDPTRDLRDEDRHNRANIIGLADPLERLHAENEGLALVGLDEVRHVGIDHARRDRVNADAPAARAPPRSTSPACRSRPWWRHRPTGCRRRACAPREETRTTLLPSPSTGRNCCTRKYGARTLT